MDAYFKPRSQPIALFGGSPPFNLNLFDGDDYELSKADWVRCFKGCLAITNVDTCIAIHVKGFRMGAVVMEAMIEAKLSCEPREYVRVAPESGKGDARKSDVIRNHEL